MDNRFRQLGLYVNFSSSNALGSWSAVTSATGYQAGGTRQLDSPATASMYSLLSTGIKRKRGDFIADRLHTTSLLLGLGHSSCTSDSTNRNSPSAHTMPTSKETDDGSSVDLGLNFHLNIGNENSAALKKPVNALEMFQNEHECELQLSLSVGPSESVVTETAPASAQNQDTFIVSVPIVDEGSTSSRWKCGSKLLPYLYAAETTTGIPQAAPDGSTKPQDPNPMPTMVQMQKSPVACTSGVAHLQQANTSTKTCQYPGCIKGARGASGFCIAHGGGRRCQKAGCTKGAEGRTIFCKAHGGGRRCEYLGCTKSAEGRTDFCIAHGGGRRCSLVGCIRAARGKSGLCIRHGGGKRCQKENCTKSAEGHSGLCIAHGGGRRCQFPQCTKGAQGTTIFCKAHGGGKRCTYSGCTKGAEGSTPFCKAHGGGKRCSFPGGCSKSVHGGTQFCVAHGGGKRCAAPECTKSARGRTDYCVRHGGGKRCKFDSCSKSAQGSTDFCKAHGGGKRCAWGHAGSGLGVGRSLCDRFTRGKIGLCAAHTALLEDHRVHGGDTVGAVAVERTPSHSPVMMGVAQKDIVEEENGSGSLLGWAGLNEINFTHPAHYMQSMSASLPEGRVHGGRSIMTLPASTASPGSHSGIPTCKWL